MGMPGMPGMPGTAGRFAPPKAKRGKQGGLPHKAGMKGMGM